MRYPVAIEELDLEDISGEWQDRIAKSTCNAVNGSEDSEVEADNARGRLERISMRHLLKACTLRPGLAEDCHVLNGFAQDTFVYDSR